MLEISEKDLERLTTFLKRKFGLVLFEKKALVESRLGFYIKEKGFSNYTDYLNYVFSDHTGKELSNMVDKLTTNHTYFMREHEHFQHFTDVFLPKMEKAFKNEKEKEIRIWSAGCSYGNEPYNIVICLLEYFGIYAKQWDFKILATDISFTALRTAKLGIYKSDAMERIDPILIEKYFKKQKDGSYQVSDRVRENVVFKYHNLMDEIKFKKDFDLIFCRNVMIYFDETTRHKLTESFYDASKPGAYLYIGHTENLSSKTSYKKERPSVYIKE